MNHNVETPMTFGKEDKVHVDKVLPVDSLPVDDLIDPSEELEWLMSLALDDALDADEATRLDRLLRQEPANAERWVAWQSVDSAFQQMPHVLPPVDFGEKFALRLEIQERRRRLRTGIIFGVAAVAIWGSVLVGVGVLSALLWSNQTDLLAGITQNLTYWWVAIRQFGQAVLNILNGLWAAPQARALAVCYVVLAFGILAGWFVILRRTTRELPLADAQLVEA